MPTLYKIFSGLNKEGGRNLEIMNAAIGPDGLLYHLSLDRMCILIQSFYVASAPLSLLLHLIMLYDLFVNNAKDFEKIRKTYCQVTKKYMKCLIAFK